MALSLFITAWHTYFHHAGLDTQDDYEASHNIVHKWYNILTGNLGYHTAHHIRGGMHWSKLPEFPQDHCREDSRASLSCSLHPVPLDAEQVDWRVGQICRFWV